MANFMKQYTDGGGQAKKKETPKIETPIITPPIITPPPVTATPPQSYTGNFFINDGNQYQEVEGDRANWQNTAQKRGWQFFDTLPDGTQYYGLDGQMHGGTPTTPTVTPTVTPTGTPTIPTIPTIPTQTPTYNVPDNIVWEAPTPPPAYVDPLASKINEYLDRILTPPQFNYDYQTDPKYQVYKDEYTGLGNVAFENTVGRASALTGGRPSSWAMSAASQARNSYMQDLANIIPTLEQQAYSRHRDSIGDIYNQLGVLQGMSKDSYGRYRDTVGDYQTDRNFGRGIYESDRGYGRDVYEDERDFQTRQDEQARNEWIGTIGQFSNDYQKEINRINASGDTSEQWKIPYLTIARQEKIKQTEAEKIAQNQATLENRAAKAQAQGKAAQEEYDKAIDLWKQRGEANEWIAEVLGIDVGDKTADYDMKKSNAEKTNTSGLGIKDYSDYIDSTFYSDDYETVYDEFGKPTQVKTGKKTISEADKFYLMRYLVQLYESGVDNSIIDQLAAKYSITGNEKLNGLTFEQIEALKARNAAGKQ